MNPTHLLRRSLPALAAAALVGLAAGCPSFQVTIGNCAQGDVCEAEPNDLRAEATPIDFGQSVSGEIDEFDTDVFQLTLTSTSDLRLEALDWSGAEDCASMWIHMELLDAAGNTLETDNGSGEGFCPTIDPGWESSVRALAPGTYFIRLTWTGDSDTTYSYRVLAQRTAACGDGVIAGTEQCDDGNIADGDGCSQACRREVGQSTPETEPNDSAAQANALTLPALESGTFSSGSDVDSYRFTLAAPAGVTLKTTDWQGDDWCFNVDTALELRTADGALVASNDDVSNGYCSLIDPASQPAVRNLAAGTYVVYVRQYFTATEGYLLSVVTQTAVP